MTVGSKLACGKNLFSLSPKQVSKAEFSLKKITQTKGFFRKITNNVYTKFIHNDIKPFVLEMFN